MQAQCFTLWASFDLSKFKVHANVMVDNTRIIHNALPNIFIQLEPTAIVNNDSFLLNHYQHYDKILTYNKVILDSCPNAKFYIHGTTWIDKDYYSNINTHFKKFKISSLAGSKLFPNAAGHALRQEIHHNQKILHKYPIVFFRSSKQTPHIKDYGNNPLLHNKIELFHTFQFSIIIENSKQINYFTEKIMDCILTKTIPIYYGCPNISDFFDTEGWIIIDTLSDLKQLFILSDTYYETYQHVIDKNYETALKYVDLYTNLNDAL